MDLTDNERVDDGSGKPIQQEKNQKNEKKAYAQVAAAEPQKSFKDDVRVLYDRAVAGRADVPHCVYRKYERPEIPKDCTCTGKL